MKKFKFGDKDILVKVRYKGGYVVWRMYWNMSNHVCWGLYNIPNNYSPRKVSHHFAEYLIGKKLYIQMVKAAAASHNWEIMKRIKDSKIIKNRERWSDYVV